MRLQSTKCLVENSIIDGLKSRLMQYSKHVVEDDGLFTKVISKFKPVTVKWQIIPANFLISLQRKENVMSDRVGISFQMVTLPAQLC